MSQNILVVEYEPRYADRVRAALNGQPFHAEYAKDGEEAMRSLDAHEPKLIVLSSVVPKISAPDLIRIIRGRAGLQKTPILLTVSGYTGSAPKQDAARMGASDILPKPYSESEFLGKVQQLLGVGQLTSSEIFGDVLEDSAIAQPGVKKVAKANDNVDKMLEATLAGVMHPKKDPSKPKTSPGTSDLDKRLQDTLSGLEKSARRPSMPGTIPVPKPAPVTPPPLHPDNVLASPPVLTPPPVAAPARVEEEPTDGTAFGQYVLLEKIATGGMAEVWKARMRGVEGFQKIVAIKKILPHLSDNQEFIEMFIDEAKLAAQLNHNNIIHIYDLGKVADSYYIAMEFVDGHDLKNILRRAQEHGQPIQVELAMFIATKVASALDYAHRKRDFEQKDLGLVHRDVSPQNVLVSQDGDIKLCDFGIAKAATKASHTQVGALKGKLQYMSPEQASGKAIDRRADIFALGVVLYEMLTQRKLFTGESEMSIIEQVREARVQQPPSEINDEATPEIDRIVLKALAKDPESRYQTAADMARDIDSVLYNFKPQPTSADLAIYMHRLWSAAPVFAAPAVEPVHQPVVDRDDLATVAPPPKPVVAPAASKPSIAMPAWEAPAKKRSPVVPLAIAGVLVLGAVGGFLYVRSRNSAQPVAAVARPVAATASVAPAPASAVAPVNTQTQPVVDTAPPPVVATAPDADLVNQEVQKRLAAERAKLEQQSRAAQTPPPPLITLNRPAPAPAPVQQQPVTQTVAPVQTATQEPPPAPAPAPPPATAPAPAPVTETVARAREGDLIPTGTEGLTLPRMTRRGTAPYPPMARAQRVEGTIVCSVLVSETGQVLDVRIIRGIERGGLNEAAIQILRRSTFTPGTKDGVRVKAWTSVPIDFKL